MAIHTAKIDANDVKTWLAYNDTTGLVENITVDPVLKAVLIFLVTANTNTSKALNTAKIDANDVKTLVGYNQTSGLVEALRCGNGGELLISL